MKKEKQTAEQPGVEQNMEQNLEQNTENAAEQAVNDTENTEQAEAEPTPEESLAKLGAAYAELEKTKQKIEAEKQELAGQLTRLQADFDNFRRRTRTEKEDWQKNITAAFCSELLPVIDNFGRALQALKASETDAGHTAGVEMIARQLAELLAAKGVEKIPAVGEEFDPNWHEAIGQTPVEDEAMVGKITEEIQAGYRIGDKVLRASMVHVGAK